MDEREIMALIQILQRLSNFLSQSEAMWAEQVLGRELQKVKSSELPQNSDSEKDIS